MSVIRPLMCFDKDGTTGEVREIDTSDPSNLQEPDCCTVLMPRKPVTRGKFEICEGAEAKLDVDGLVERALDVVKIVPIEAYGASSRGVQYAAMTMPSESSNVISPFRKT